MANGTPIGRVRGLGSAKEGTHHWWNQRVTAAANLVLMLWFVISIARLPAYDYATATGWLQSPWAAIPMVLLIASVFYHFRLGLQVVIEDYVHDEGRVALMLLLTFFTITTAGIAIFSILKIAFSGTPA
ncbi:succinate dehydrogenase, hydrophobic membrane anchor protein [Sphingomonas sp.]|uniref:succinate dehydrogenase, hydrophobic membrane anchor protein n=1 Tax=Sphingomonas sp. TaxID=28214 RepID=UPI002CC45340|nr:succinate dehydrogenase, hydrophobic membrane anchor protein [Sphingomonas sp.]HWK35246.1 succinate dehydrogenase, hydrophobic membrane anchor protein [Sphingomonas sp.]